MRRAPAIELNPEQKTALERLARQRSVPARLVERARIVLLAADGLENQQIATEMRMTPEKAARWRSRFLQGGIPAIEKDAPRPGRKRTITDPKVKRVVRMTLEQTPVNATHWSTRSMAQAAGISEASVRRIDLFNPDTGAGGIAGHVLVDGAWGHVKQFFGANIDPKVCPF